MQSNGKQIITSKRLFVLLLLLLVGLLVIWLYNHSMLSIETLGNSSSTTTIKVTNSAGETKTYQSKSGKKTLLVNKGEYAVAVISGNKSGLTSTETKSFLRRSSVKVKLSDESSRRYAAYNPSPCMFGVGDVFYSIGCGDYGTNIEQQLPARGNLPPTTTSISNSTLYDTILAAAPLDRNTVALLTENSTDEGAAYGLKIVDRSLSTLRNISLNVGRNVSTLQLTPLSASEIMVYSLDSEAAWRVDAVSGEVNALDLSTKNSEGMTLSDVRSNSGVIVALYSDVSRTDALEEDSLANANSTLVVLDDSGMTSFKVSGGYRQASACGEGYICAVDFYGLRIFTTNKTIHQTGFIPNVKEIVSTPNGPRFIDDIGVFTYDPSAQSGHYEYSFGQYKSCGTQATSTGYLLCLITPKLEKVALAIDQNTPAKDLIDKQVLKLLNHSEVAGVNAVGNDLFIIPNYGEVDMFVKSAQKLKEVNSKITTIIKDSGIDTSVYRVRNAAE
jgi:hypothetical protein